jgi:hypothetical protein
VRRCSNSWTVTKTLKPIDKVFWGDHELPDCNESERDYPVLRLI